MMSMFLSMKKGVSRGIFSNEAGLGTGSIAHACADYQKTGETGNVWNLRGVYRYHRNLYPYSTCHPVQQYSRYLWRGCRCRADYLGFTSTYGNWVSVFTAIAMCCFAFSTALGWGLYGARCIEFLFSEKVIKPFMVVYSLVASWVLLQTLA